MNVASNDASEPSAILHQLSGFSAESWENPSLIQIPVTNPSENRLSNATSLHSLEDSGYDSPSSKTEESQILAQPIFGLRAVSAPLTKSKPSRIPISESCSKLRLKRNLQPMKLIPPQQIISASQFSPVGNEQGQSLTEESFLRKSRGQLSPVHGHTSQHNFPITPSHSPRCPSKSVPTLNQLDKSDSVRKLAPPHFNIRPPSPGLCASGQLHSTSPVQLPSMTTMLKSSESFKAIQTLVDQTVNEILDNGQKDFSGKYSTWIQQIFNLHLEKIHNRLKQVYMDKLSQSLASKKEEVLQIKTSYRTKLLEFESATKKFQDWYDDVLEENRQQALANHQLLTDLTEKEAALQKEHESQLQSRLLQLESEAEKERARDLERHAEEIKKIQEKALSQNQLIAAQYQHQLDSLKEQLEVLQNTNTSLREKYAELCSRESDSGGACSGDDEVMTDHGILTHDERQELKTEIYQLEQKVKEMEMANLALAAGHADELKNLQETLDANNQKLRQMIKETRMSAIQTRHEREQGIKNMQVTILQKETEYKRQLNALTERYGKKIEDLTSSVEALRHQLLAQCE